jgi:hypothetical protein
LSENQDFGGAWVRPDGEDMAVLLGPAGLVVVHPDGADTSLRLP